MCFLLEICRGSCGLRDLLRKIGNGHLDSSTYHLESQDMHGLRPHITVQTSGKHCLTSEDTTVIKVSDMTISKDLQMCLFPMPL